MMAQFVIPVIASILISGTLVIGLTEDVFAPKPQPVKIKIGPVIPTGGNTIELGIGANFGQVDSQSRANFTVCTTLTITQGGAVLLTIDEPQCHPLVKDPHADRRADDLTACVPQTISLGDDLITGSAEVTGQSVLRNPNGQPVGNGTDDFDETVEFPR